MSDTPQTQQPLSDREQLEALQKRLDQWKAKARQQLEEAQRKNESLRRQLDTVTADRDSLRSKEDDRAVACDALVARAVALEEKLSAAETKLKEQGKEMQRLREAHAAQIQSLEAETAQLRVERDSLLEQRKKLTAEAAAALQREASNNNNQNTSSSQQHQHDTAKNDDGGDARENGSSDDGSTVMIGDTGDEVQNQQHQQRRNNSTNNNNAGNFMMRIAMLEQQIEERDCRIAVLNALYTQAKAEARSATSSLNAVKDEHARSVDQLRSSIATMTVQVAAKSSAIDSVRQQLDDANKRAAWFESEVLRLRDDAAERERAFDEVLHSTNNNLDEHLIPTAPIMIADNNINGNKKLASSHHSKGSSGLDDDGFVQVSGADSGVASPREQQQSHMQSKLNQLEEQLNKATQNLEQANSNLHTKEMRCRHLELRVEEQTGMVRHLAKQLSDAQQQQNNQGRTRRVNISSSSVAGDESGGDQNGDDGANGNSNNNDALLNSFANTNSTGSSAALRRCLESTVLTLESSKIKLQRMFQVYRVLAPVALVSFLLVVFLVWFSRGAGPQVNKLEFFAKRNEELELEMGTVRAAYQRLKEKCP